MTVPLPDEVKLREGVHPQDDDAVPGALVLLLLPGLGDVGDVHEDVAVDLSLLPDTPSIQGHVLCTQLLLGALHQDLLQNSQVLSTSIPARYFPLQRCNCHHWPSWCICSSNLLGLYWAQVSPALCDPPGVCWTPPSARAPVLSCTGPGEQGEVGDKLQGCYML